ncbi:MAG: helix-turn-helix domain-containing protein [Limnochordia bacterium]|nr:helix-turn-helix domain-containing protein [Limnochordia bacterium]
MVKIDGVDYLELIEYSVDYVEKNLTSDLKREDISKEIGMSMYHFHRIFKSWVGESILDYLTRRRLTEAARQLRFTNDRIIDIAMQYGYRSQEAFTRAFEGRFGINPGEYRMMGEPILTELPPLTHEKLIHLHDSLVREPQIVEVPQLTLVGIKRPCLFPYDDKELTLFWDQLLPHISEVHGTATGTKLIEVYEHIPSTGGFYNTSYCFFTGVPVQRELSILPTGMVQKTIARAKYAVFTRKNAVISRLELHRFIHGAWLPNSKYQRVNQDILVVLADGPDSPEFDVYLPIK